MNPDVILDEFSRSPDAALISPVLLRLSRGQQGMREILDPLLDNPLHRALAGLESAQDEPPSADLGETILWAQARVDEGRHPPLPLLIELEARAMSHAQWWAPAARLHARCSTSRENQARMALSEQSLPYVFPGSIDPMQIELLAAGDCILPALHVDWVRKLSGFVLDVLVLDLQYSGGWFWPLLEVLDGKKAARVILATARRPRKGLGGLGMMGAYLSRLGDPFDALLPEFGPADDLLAAVAIVGERPA